MKEQIKQILYAMNSNFEKNDLTKVIEGAFMIASLANNSEIIDSLERRNEELKETVKKFKEKIKDLTEHSYSLQKRIARTYKENEEE